MNEPRIAIGTLNTAKISAVRAAASTFFTSCECLPVKVVVEAPDQPWGERETFEGARSRAEASSREVNADLSVGIESGLWRGPDGRIYVISWAVVIDCNGNIGAGSSERFALPQNLASLLWTGGELGPTIKRYFPEHAEQLRDQGIVSLLTEGKRNRTDILKPAIIHALSAFASSQIWDERATSPD